MTRKDSLEATSMEDLGKTRLTKWCGVAWPPAGGTELTTGGDFSDIDLSP